MPSGRRAPAILRALVAGLIAAGVMTLVVTVPSIGAGASDPAAAVPAAFEPSGDPGGDPGEPDPPPTDPVPTDPPSEEPTDPPTDPPSDPPSPEPTVAPTPPKPSQRPRPTGVPHPTFTQPEQPGPVLPGRKPRLAALVLTDDIALRPSYWSYRSTRADLRVLVANTGTIVERVTMRYTLPVGLTDAGTPGCRLAAGRTYVCGSWTVGPGLRFATSVRVRVAGDAWRRMPLGGSVDVTASAPGRPDLGTVSDNQGFAVLFPPGPPVAGIRLDASEVAFVSATEPADLAVRLTNTGNASSIGAVEVVLPEGVTVGTHPAGCATAGDRTRCELGRVAAGATVTATLPLLATVEAQRLAPLSGAVSGMLTARGRTKQMQMSFRITAAAATATPPANPDGAAGPTASQGVIGGFTPVSGSDGGLTTVQKTALALVVVSILLVILAIALATTSLRKGLEVDTTAQLDVPVQE